jgi:hypothetical protein
MPGTVGTWVVTELAGGMPGTVGTCVVTELAGGMPGTVGTCVVTELAANPAYPPSNITAVREERSRDFIGRSPVFSSEIYVLFFIVALLASAV